MSMTWDGWKGRVESDSMYEPEATCPECGHLRSEHDDTRGRGWDFDDRRCLVEDCDCPEYDEPELVDD